MTSTMHGSSVRASADEAQRSVERDRAIANRRRSAQLAIKASELTGQPVPARIRAIAEGDHVA